MSAFLGKIHYWLYNKITLQEKLIGEISALAQRKGFEIDPLIQDSYAKFGAPVTGELENEIEHSNIHGWLQEQIIGVESRLAYLATELINMKVVSQEEIANLFFADGEERGREQAGFSGSPEQCFQLIFDYMLEGMPCDRVNQIVSNTEEEMVWETTRDLHQPYWDNVGGDIENYYVFRNRWVEGFLSQSEFNYQRSNEGINIISRRA